jgi:3-deoxy-D-arabino-heptulosonate 7-phosphate (DAHP) synthase
VLAPQDFDTLDQIEPLIQPALLRHELPLSQNSRKTIEEARQAAADIISGRDDRILVIVGPCSIHGEEIIRILMIADNLISQSVRSCARSRICQKASRSNSLCPKSSRNHENV